MTLMWFIQAFGCGYASHSPPTECMAFATCSNQPSLQGVTHTEVLTVTETWADPALI